MNLSHVTARVGERRGGLPALSSKSHMIPKGSLKKKQRRENIITTPKHSPSSKKRGKRPLTSMKDDVKLPSTAAHSGWFLPLPTDEEHFLHFHTAQKNKRIHSHQATGHQVPAGFVPGRGCLIAVVFQLTWLSCSPWKHPPCSLWFHQVPRISFFTKNSLFPSLAPVQSLI